MTLPGLESVSSAAVSADGVYRYELRRTWGPLPPCAWVMLNPSTADADVDDPTIRRCMGFAKRWGAGGIIVGNLYALRATDPAALAVHDDPRGPDNTNWWRLIATEASAVVCAWGAHRMASLAAPALLATLRQCGIQPQCIGRTKAGAPRHPLYVKGGAVPVPLVGAS